jgi:hypothetical protein
LVAFREASLLSAGDRHDYSQDEVAFQQLFCAVAGPVGLAGRLKATGYFMPPPVEGEDDEA